MCNNKCVIFLKSLVRIRLDTPETMICGWLASTGCSIRVELLIFMSKIAWSSEQLSLVTDGCRCLVMIEFVQSLYIYDAWQRDRLTDSQNLVTAMTISSTLIWEMGLGRTLFSICELDEDFSHDCAGMAERLFHWVLWWTPRVTCSIEPACSKCWRVCANDEMELCRINWLSGLVAVQMHLTYWGTFQILLVVTGVVHDL